MAHEFMADAPITGELDADRDVFDDAVVTGFYDPPDEIRCRTGGDSMLRLIACSARSLELRKNRICINGIEYFERRFNDFHEDIGVSRGCPLSRIIHN